MSLVDIIHSLTLSLSTGASLLLSVALLVFLWGIVQFITQAGDEKNRSAGRQKIAWGIVGLALIIAVWGVVNLLSAILGASTSTTVCPSPTIDLAPGSVKVTEECQ